jgi:NAD(P)-dependent dehydrogenase (short-subunit alcohol dehydrogenase family)
MGLAIARTFGRRGFAVALISRSQQKLDALAQTLAEEGIAAKGFTADVLDRPSLVAALRAAGEHFGPVDVLEYSPAPHAPVAGFTMTTPSQTTVEDLQPQVEYYLYGALEAARAVLPAMRESGAGTLLFTTGGGSVNPAPMMGNVNAAAAGLRNWVLNLGQELSGTGVHVAHVAINVWIGEGAPAGYASRSPEQIAPLYWELHEARDRAEVVYTG